MLRSFTEFSYQTLNFCSTQPPFDNELVRQAVQRGIDREAINRLWLQESGQPAYGFWPLDHANFADDLVEDTSFDLDEAKRLMAESGATNVAVELYYPTNPAWEPLADLLQGQLAEIGIAATIVPSPQIVDQFIAAKKPGAMFVPGSRAGVDKVLKIFGPGQQQNLCDANRTEIVDLAGQVAAMPPDDPEAPDLWKDIDRENAEHAYVVFLVQSPNFTALNRDRGGWRVVRVADQVARVVPELREPVHQGLTQWGRRPYRDHSVLVRKLSSEIAHRADLGVRASDAVRPDRSGPSGARRRRCAGILGLRRGDADPRVTTASRTAPACGGRARRGRRPRCGC